MAERYDGRILDRLKELVVFLPVGGESYRAKIYAENLNSAKTAEAENLKNKRF
jgi:hypothetical protein